MTTDQLCYLIFSFFSYRVVTTKEREDKSSVLDGLENPSELLLVLATIRTNLGKTERALSQSPDLCAGLSNGQKQQVIEFIKWYAEMARAEIAHRRDCASRRHG